LYDGQTTLLADAGPDEVVDGAELVEFAGTETEADTVVELLGEVAIDELDDVVGPPRVIVVGPVSGMEVVMVEPPSAVLLVVFTLAELLSEVAIDELDVVVEPPRVIVVGPVSGMEVVMVEPPSAVLLVVVAFALIDGTVTLAELDNAVVVVSVTGALWVWTTEVPFVVHVVVYVVKLVGLVLPVPEIVGEVAFAVIEKLDELIVVLPVPDRVGEVALTVTEPLPTEAVDEREPVVVAFADTDTVPLGKLDPLVTGAEWV